ncbi:MAG TPA: filamentous hemagglutinin N-terminal domain-containing protein, partial [Steroidobacteraceae bacterium]|nr:filamentous hemagglutinin N-terminal domain-containing protein [Steroidobacteraceae bacterium]
MSVLRYSCLLVMSGVASGLRAAELPIPCIAGSCGTAVPGFVTAGQAQAVQAGNTLTIEQLTDSATLNWQSFNISADGKVTFKQPDAASVALNRIFQGDASRILGSLTANGRIFLVNQNGIVFGEGAQVNAAGLIASSLDITPAALERGIAQAVQESEPAFRAFADPDGNLAGGAVRVERGATIESAGGQVLLFALSQVENRGTIRTPDGQTILAAGDTVFLAASTDPNLRGLLVEVGAGGTVTNGVTNASPSTPPEQLVGNIIAERGNITLAGLAVNQLGRVSATTSVRANGSIRLIARDQAEVAGGTFELVPGRGGDLVLGAGSHTAVTLDLADTATAIDATAQPRSQVRLDGHSISVMSGSEIIANGGTIDVTARAIPSIAPTAFTAQNDGSRIRIADDVLLDVSGARVNLPVERNVLRVELRGNQLRDSPAQRDGPLRGEAVFVDIRRTGTRDDGSTWVGTPLADLAGDVSTITRGVGERNLSGGSILLQSQGDALVSGGARLDVTGGRINYANGFINTTRLMVADGTSVDIGRADPERTYTGILDTSSQVNRRWGITENYTVNGFDSRGAFEQGYVEGKDAGSVTLSAPQLIFDGAISGQTVHGPYQRTPGASLAAGAFRPFDQVPFGASLIVGNATPEVDDVPDNVVGGVRIESGRLLGTLRNESGGLFDLLQDSLSAEETTFRLRPELLGIGGATRVSLFANDTIEIPSGVTLDLGQGGSFSAAAGRVLSAGVLRLPGGTVALEARPGVAVDTGETLLHLASGARIEAQGGWVNDNPLLGAGRDALFTSGGTVSLSAEQGELLLESGSAIDVSGGAQRRADGRIVAGRGGSLSFATTPALDGSPFVPTLGSDISAFSFSRGGQLSITAPALCISATNCASEDVSMLWLSHRLFAEHGFADFRLRSNLGGVSVAPGTELLVSQLNRLPGQGIASLASSDNAASAARIGVLPTQEQLATSINMNAQIAVLTSPLSAEEFAETPALTIGTGAIVQTQARGQISLNANSRIAVDGLLAAPAGRIDIGLDAGLRIQEFLPSQAIWFGDHAHLSAAGLARVYLDALGSRRGEVLSGGAITINAQRGYVLGQPGSLFDVSGTSATLDLRRVAGGVTGLAPQVVNSAGGRVSITAAEGVLWSGEFLAQGGSTAVPGGQLTVTLAPNLRNDPGLFAPAFLTGARRIELTPTVAPIVIAAGASVPATFNGRALLSTTAIEAGGFDSVALAADDIIASAFFGGTLGQIALKDASLTLRRALTLDASVITGQGVNRLSAPYVSIGHNDALRQLSLQTLAPGNAQLRVDAGHIDLIGAISFDGFDALRLDSSGDIRLRGVQRPLERRYAGSLLTNANLTLEAAQIFPATLTDYAIRVTDNPEGTVSILTGATDQRAPVLSVGGSLSVNAPSIRQAGFLRAPLGSITLAGDDVVLASGSYTSTSLEGVAALFGSTQAGLDWVYQLPDLQTLVFGSAGDALPAQRIELDGTRVSVDAGATVNLGGGGDLRAYEFVPGVGGSRDLLANDVRPNQFAIVPSLGNSFGPFDTREFQGTSLNPGDSVYLAGAEGLPAGLYTL